MTVGRPDAHNGGVYALLGALAVLGGLAAAGLHAVNAAAGRTVEPSFWLMQVTVALTYGLLTVVLRRRAAPALRLTVAVVAVGAAVSMVASEWGMADPGAGWMVWLGSWGWAPGYVAIIALLPQLLPDGVPLSPRWRPAVLLGVATVVVVGGWWALLPYEAQDFPEAYAGLSNPVGVDLVAGPAPSGALGVLLVAAVLIAGASVVLRWRRSAGMERQQLKWVLLGVLATLVLVALARVLPLELGEPVAALAMVPLPLAIGVAVLRHGLWDVEVVFSRTLVYGAVAAVAVGVYVGVVAVVGTVAEDQPGRVSLVAVAVLAPLLLPLHAALQRRVNRWVHGDEEEPWQELARLGERLGAVADPEELVERVLPGVLRRVRRALRARVVRLRLADGTELVDGTGLTDDDAVPGRDGPGDAGAPVRDAGPTVAVPLDYAGERLGTLELSRDGGLGATERDLLDRWAAQAAVAVHTVLMAREARRSRELVVVAREEERRRLRRDLHDGVGPSLAALALQVETARDLTGDDPEAAAGLLATLAPRINAVVADVRSLVHELRPATLDDLGLAGATRELAARLSGAARVVVEADGLGPLPAAVEVAAYRIAGEAVTNAVRHSGAATVEVLLRRDPTALVVRVADDGSGLAGDHVPGVGLASMRHRAEELGGSLVVQGTPAGTTVTALLPLAVAGIATPGAGTATPGAVTATPGDDTGDGTTPSPHPTDDVLLAATPAPPGTAPTTGAAR